MSIQQEISEVPPRETNGKVTPVNGSRSSEPKTLSASCTSSMLIAAQAADALLSIKGIQASFVLAETASGISISGRSLGQVNVQLILERIGGGGHLAVAGAQLKDITMNEAVDKLTDSIYSYLDEIGADYTRS